MRRRKIPARHTPPQLIALDPAKRRCGLAIYHGTELVRGCTLYAQTTFRVASLVRQEIDNYATNPRAVVLVELPKTYDDQRAKDPNLAGLHELIDIIDNALPNAVLATHPSEWKGGVPKDICARRIRSVLSNTEIGAMSDMSEDTYDAIGLGLWYLGRAGRGMTS